ncbi:MULTISPECIES: aminodeoxychorismate synthase, component I [Halobacterium]|uniref:aminodeoxychorismate synthase, component I n=1 Tax=Halobacterium TaxID=2239 RepID=UPI0019639716|nr:MULTISPECIES: aminodeoxychorismate synthase, component I [Halobacterium]MCF2164134.1 aminodeoxychorismate synthase, component I [Halobacterium salinarum]MCF2167790.1 aminodeoxychorismate synthase, component I [Halobacterium salinarum]QRY22995.1 aminodeoxychorismate synthase, component I [Halobacterium sp. GSL-19]
MPDSAALATDPAAFRDAAGDATAPTRAVVEARLPVTDPFAAYRRARGDAPSFHYETTGGSDGWGYFGVDPASMLRADGAGALDTVQAAVGARLARVDCDVPHPGGLFGWLSYDIARELEAIPDTTTDARGLPRLQLGVYPTIAAWREPFTPGDDLRLIAAVPVDEYTPDGAFEAGRDRVQALAAAIRDGDPAVGPPPADSPAPFESAAGRAAFEARVRRIQDAIRDGDTFQANVSHRLDAPAAVHPVAVFEALRDTNPAPYSGIVEFPGVDLVSASPELLLARRGRELTTEPIAGTRPRGATPAEDDAARAALRADDKERAEHAMLVDLERNDLGKVSEYGSVAVPDYRRVDAYSEVLHLVSEVTGRLRESCSLRDAIAAVFPGGTITGAPKPRTMALIDTVEATRRGPYTGSLAAIGFDGDATLSITIRTLVRRAATYHLRVGAGIVHDSTPAAEYDETLAKARALVTALGDAGGIGRVADTTPDNS